ncbi:MAG: type II toxin-antitoxin system VapC family toxin [Fimbriimonadales bacterium]
MKKIVIDASVALKWVLNDEEHIAEASQTLLDWRTRRLELAAPDLLYYEYCNALWVAVRQSRLSQQDAYAAIEFFGQIGIAYHSAREFWKKSLGFAFGYQRTFYDCVYVALAEQMGVWFFTGDRRLYNALSPHLPFVRWIGDYDWNALPEAPQNTG